MKPAVSLRRFHGRRKGRKLTARQNQLIESVLPSVRVPLHCLKPEIPALIQLFREPVQDVWLEIGFGGGEHLTAQLDAYPEIGMIGAEPFVNGAASALQGLCAKQITDRVLLWDDDVTPLLDWLPEGSLGRCFMLFPDPWPKKRHRGRRLLDAGLLNALARLLRPAGEFRFASDIEDYVSQAEQLAEATSQFSLALKFDGGERAGHTDWPQTRYERKAIQAGRDTVFLKLQRL